MGLWNLENPGRAGSTVAKYDGWAMVNIIQDYSMNRNLMDADTRIEFRRALLVSQEIRRIQEGRRINV